jgi:hypothetical protein
MEMPTRTAVREDKGVVLLENESSLFLYPITETKGKGSNNDYRCRYDC